MAKKTQEQPRYRLIKLDEDSYRIERLFDVAYEPIVAVTEPSGAQYWWRPTPTGRVNGKVFMKGTLEECREQVTALKEYDEKVGKPPEEPGEDAIVYV